jgi:hypothetical protein
MDSGSTGISQQRGRTAVRQPLETTGQLCQIASTQRNHRESPCPLPGRDVGEWYICAMRARPPTLLIATAAVLTVWVAGCEAKVYGAPDAPPAPVSAPEAPASVPGAGFDGLAKRVEQATHDAAADGATISVAILDRATDRLVSNGNDQLLAIASVAKLFIADDMLSQQSGAEGTPQLSSPDREALDSMLRSSDDGPAETFWAERGGESIITEVASRYGLTATAAPSDGQWWNTVSSASDLVHYYDRLLNGSGGLSSERAQIIVNDLAGSTTTGADGYPQRFGIPDGLYAEPVAVKQGWMCCMDGSSWMHLSTGIVGADRRYVLVIESLQPSDDATARATITQAVKTMFPSGRI